jgi:hypothetical protein
MMKLFRKTKQSLFNINMELYFINISTWFLNKLIEINIIFEFNMIKR